MPKVMALVYLIFITSTGFTLAQNTTASFVAAGSILTSYYTFSTGAFLADSSDANQNLNPSKNPPRPSTDCYTDNACAEFNATLLNSFNKTTNQYGSSMSICLWFMAYSRATPPQALFNFGGGVNTNEIYLALANDDNIQFFIGVTNRRTFITNTGVFSANRWHHVCITRQAAASESSSAWSIYVNGTKYAATLQYSISVNGATFPDLPASTPTTQNYIGQPISGRTLSFFNGKIDEFRWYNNAIDTPNVTALYRYYRYHILNITRQTNP
jgi:hypothetical protein